MSMQRFYLDVVVGGRRGPLAALLRAGLRVLSWGYRPLIGLRNLAYDRGWRQVTRLEKPVVSVGNLTTGGTGKTPWVMEVVRRLEVAGHDPVVLSRGYHGGETADEPAMLEAALGEGRVFVDADRVEAGRRALSQRTSADRVVLDDGFQHRRLGRDLDLVLIDATRPFGGGAILPRGLMREPKTALGRADMIILTRVNRVDPAAVEAITRRIKEVAPEPPVVTSALIWDHLVDADGQTHSVELLADQSVIGACGVGNPTAFEQDLEAAAGEVIQTWVRPDHHDWAPREITRLLAEAAAGPATTVVTTEKDWVKWAPHLNTLAAGHEVTLLRPQQRVKVLDNEEALDRRLAELGG